MGDKPREFDLERTQKLERACEEWRVVASHDRQGRPTSRPVAAGPPLTRRADSYDVGNYRVPDPEIERAARELGWTPEEGGAAEWLVARARHLLLEAHGARQSDGTDAGIRLTDARNEAEIVRLTAERDEAEKEVDRLERAVARLTAEVDRLALTLRCERGEWMPDGWRLDEYNEAIRWEHVATGTIVRLNPGGAPLVTLDYGERSGLPTEDASSVIEAIERAAAKFREVVDV